MSKKRKRPAEPPIMTFRTLTVCFSKRTVDIDGRTITINPDMDCLSLPILGGDAIFMPNNGFERIA